MKIVRILSGSLLALAISSHVHGQVAFNCSSFNSGTGTCGANTGSTGPFKIIGNHGSITGSGQLQLAPANTSHTALAANYTTPVNVQAFSTTYTFIPSGNVLAFVLQNTNNQPGYQGIFFVAGAGCEGGFFQASNVGVGGQSPNNVFALSMDGFNYLTPGASSFAYSGTAMYQATQDPCKPNDGDPVYNPVNNISTSPVPLNNPVNTPNTTTGHTYSVTITYDGSNLIENLFDVTAGGSCPGAQCFSHTWTGVNIPAIVGGSNTALAGITASTISAGNAGAVLINSWSYTQGSPTPPVAVYANSPAYNWQVLPGSVRHINVNIDNSATNKINWSVLSTTGGASATLSATSNTYPWVDVTAGSTGGTCAINGTNPYTVTSTASVTVRATSVDDTSKHADFLFNVCSPSVQASIVPFYRTLYASQKAVLQSYIQGSSNTGVTWSITAQPGGGDGALADTTNRDTVFSATVAGRYTVTATSAADGTKTATATMYVTGHAMPYQVTPNQTEPIDCTVDPALSGTTYDVGPTQTYHTLSAVPQQALTAGSTIRVHNEDLSGTSPTTYHEYVQLPTQATATQPVRMCGVPDSAGHLPVLDESNATGRSDTSTFAAGYGGITAFRSGQFGLYPNQNGARNIIIEGLAIKNTGVGNNYTPPAGGSPVGWIAGAACIRLSGVLNTVVAGNDLSHCGNGTFSDFNANSMWGAFTGFNLWEGNWLHANGNSGSFTEHQFYLQGWFQVVQFNKVDNYLAGAQGSNFKSRGIGDIVRYNYFADGPLRQIDMVENQDSNVYQTFESYLSAAGRITYPTDAYTADLLAGIQEVWHQTFLYGNIIQNTTSGWLIHFKGDHGQSGMENRTGTLYAYNNTFNTNQGIIDNDDNGGGQPVEFPKTAWWNNITWIPSIGFGTCWNRSNVLIGDFKTNLLSSVLNNTDIPINGEACNAETTPWVNSIGIFASFQLAIPLDTHLTGISAPNFLTDSVLPYNPTTYMPLAGHTQVGTMLTSAAATMPVRFQFQPNLNYATARVTPVTNNAGGIVGAVDSSTTIAATPTFSPNAGTYTSIQTVAISDTTPSSTIYYTLDGSTPTTGSTVYASPLTLNNNITIKAIAAASGFSNSAVGTASYTINLPGLWNSLAGWATCILPGCDPGGTGIPVSTNQIIRNAAPSLSGSSMKMTMVANQPDTNSLWYWFDADCDLCTNFASDFQVFPVSATGLGAIELDTAFLFSQGLNREYMWGFQYCMNGAGCPGGHNSWDVWDQTAIDWIDSGVTQAPNLNAWNHVTTTNHRVGNSQIYDTFTLNGTLHNLNLTTNSGVLPLGWDSGTGFQFQLDAISPTGSQTYTMYLDQASFTASLAPPPTLTSIAVTPAGSSKVVGSTLQYTATCTWSDASTTNCTGAVTWASSDTGKATISVGGLATAVAAGSTTITATSGAINGSTGLTVTAPTLVSITVSPVNSSVTVGGTKQYAATCNWSNLTATNCTGSVTWGSSAPTKATISAGGMATGVAGGSTTISATSSVSGSTGLTVTTGSTKVHGAHGRGRM